MANLQSIQAILSFAPEAVYPRDFTVDSSGVITSWNLTTPQPDASQLQARIDALTNAQTTQTTARATRRTQVRALAQSAVGKAITATTTAEKLALLLVYLESRILDDSGVVLPFDQWTF